MRKTTNLVQGGSLVLVSLLHLQILGHQSKTARYEKLRQETNVVRLGLFLFSYVGCQNKQDF